MYNFTVKCKKCKINIVQNVKYTQDPFLIPPPPFLQAKGMGKRPVPAEKKLQGRP